MEVHSQTETIEIVDSQMAMATGSVAVHSEAPENDHELNFQEIKSKLVDVKTNDISSIMGDRLSFLAKIPAVQLEYGTLDNVLGKRYRFMPSMVANFAYETSDLLAPATPNVFMEVRRPQPPCITPPRSPRTTAVASTTGRVLPQVDEDSSDGEIVDVQARGNIDALTAVVQQQGRQINIMQATQAKQQGQIDQNTIRIERGERKFVVVVKGYRNMSLAEARASSDRLGAELGILIDNTRFHHSLLKLRLTCSTNVRKLFSSKDLVRKHLGHNANLSMDLCKNDSDRARSFDTVKRNLVNKRKVWDTSGFRVAGDTLFWRQHVVCIWDGNGVSFSKGWKC